jgi:hypothetical protein
VSAIPDAQTVPLMAAFHRHLSAGSSSALALAKAQAEVEPERSPGISAAGGFIAMGAG